MTNVNQLLNLTIGKVSALDDINALLWYIYSIPYQIESDVLAMCCLFKMGTKYSSWLVDSSNQSVRNFLNLCQNGQGDIYFLFNLWTHIKADLIKFNCLYLDLINDQTKKQFGALKSQSLLNKSDPVINQLYRSGEFILPMNFMSTSKLCQIHKHTQSMKLSPSL